MCNYLTQNEKCFQLEKEKFKFIWRAWIFLHACMLSQRWMQSKQNLPLLYEAKWLIFCMKQYIRSNIAFLASERFRCKLFVAQGSTNSDSVCLITAADSTCLEHKGEAMCGFSLSLTTCEIVELENEKTKT